MNDFKSILDVIEVLKEKLTEDEIFKLYDVLSKSNYSFYDELQRYCDECNMDIIDLS